jgi:hypothetical protein
MVGLPADVDGLHMRCYGIPAASAGHLLPLPFCPTSLTSTSRSVNLYTLVQACGHCLLQCGLSSLAKTLFCCPWLHCVPHTWIIRCHECLGLGDSDLSLGLILLLLQFMVCHSRSAIDLAPQDAIKTTRTHSHHRFSNSSLYLLNYTRCCWGWPLLV